MTSVPIHLNNSWWQRGQQEPVFHRNELVEETESVSTSLIQEIARFGRLLPEDVT